MRGIGIVRMVVVLVMLVSQLAASAPAPGNCHDTASADPSATADHAQHVHHGAGDHGEEAEAPGDANDSTPCHCVGGFHCGHLAALVTDSIPASGAPEDDPRYPAAPLQRPKLAHRWEPDRPPA